MTIISDIYKDLFKKLNESRIQHERAIDEMAAFLKEHASGNNETAHEIRRLALKDALSQMSDVR